MPRSEEDIIALKKEVRAVLLSQTDGKGIPAGKFIKHYRELLLKPLLYKSHGYNSLEDMMASMPDVARVEFNTRAKEMYFFGVLDKVSYASVGARKASAVNKTNRNQSKEKDNATKEDKNKATKSKGSQSNSKDACEKKGQKKAVKLKEIQTRYLDRSEKEEEEQRAETVASTKDIKNGKKMKNIDDPVDPNDLKSLLCPNMKGMWAVCFEKECIGGKTEAELKEIFSEAGEVVEIHVSSRYVFIRYTSRAGAAKAIDLLGVEFDLRVPEEKKRYEQHHKKDEDEEREKRERDAREREEEERRKEEEERKEEEKKREQDRALLMSMVGKDKNKGGKVNNFSGEKNHNLRTIFVGNMESISQDELLNDIHGQGSFNVEKLIKNDTQRFGFIRFPKREDGQKFIDEYPKVTRFRRLRFQWAKVDSTGTSHDGETMSTTSTLTGSDDYVRDVNFNIAKSKSENRSHDKKSNGYKKYSPKRPNKDGGKSLPKPSLTNGHMPVLTSSYDEMPALDESDEMPELEEELPELVDDMPTLVDDMPTLEDDIDELENIPSAVSCCDGFSTTSSLGPSVTLFVSNFPYSATHELLQDLFRPYGSNYVKLVQLRFGCTTVAHVGTKTAVGAEQAVRDLNGTLFHGRQLHVDIHKKCMDQFVTLLQEETGRVGLPSLLSSGSTGSGHSSSGPPVPKTMDPHVLREMVSCCGKPFYLEYQLAGQFDIHVTSMVDKKYLWGQVQSRVEELQLFHKVKESLSKIPFKTPVPPDVMRGMVKDDKEWCRVWIMEDLPSDFARIFQIDYGKEDVVKRSEIIQVPDFFWKVMPIAVPFCFHGDEMARENTVLRAKFIGIKDFVVHVSQM